MRKTTITDEGICVLAVCSLVAMLLARTLYQVLATIPPVFACVLGLVTANVASFIGDRCFRGLSHKKHTIISARVFFAGLTYVFGVIARLLSVFLAFTTIGVIVKAVFPF